MHRKLFLSSRGPCTPNIHRAPPKLTPKLERHCGRTTWASLQAEAAGLLAELPPHMLLIVGSSHVRARTVHGAARPARTHELPRCHPGAAFGL
jgi:hypothetical protein